MTTNFGGVDVVPLLGAIAGCHCSVLWWGKGWLWGSGRGAIAGCHCRVPISVSYLPPTFRATNFTQTPKKTTMNLASCRRYTVLYIDNTKIPFAIWGLCWYNFFKVVCKKKTRSSFHCESVRTFKPAHFLEHRD